MVLSSCQVLNLSLLCALALVSIIFFSILYGTDASTGGKAAGMFYGGFLTGVLAGGFLLYMVKNKE